MPTHDEVCQRDCIYQATMRYVNETVVCQASMGFAYQIEAWKRAVSSVSNTGTWKCVDYPG